MASSTASFYYTGSSGLVAALMVKLPMLLFVIVGDRKNDCVFIISRYYTFTQVVEDSLHWF